MFKIHYPSEYLFGDHRAEIFPLLKPFLKPDSFSNLNRIEMYGVSETDYSFVCKEDCDFIILPMSLNFYSRTKRRKEIQNYIKSTNKIIYAFMSGDIGVKWKSNKNLQILRCNGYSTKGIDRGLPVFIKDPFIEYNGFYVSQDNLKTSIGFCGQSNYSRIKMIQDKLRVSYRNMYNFFFNYYEKEKLFSSSYFRGRILEKLQNSHELKTDFIQRIKYRAGAKTSEDRIASTQEYFQNIKDNLFTVCMRGGGNFSVRLYETMSMGRIPIYFHTNDHLPFKEDVFWRENTIWIEESEIHKSVDIIKTWIETKRNKLDEIAKNNRVFWNENLTMDGYFKRVFGEK